MDNEVGREGGREEGRGGGKRKKGAVLAANRECWMTRRRARLSSQERRFCPFWACPFGYHVCCEQNLRFGIRIVYRT